LDLPNVTLSNDDWGQHLGQGRERQERQRGQQQGHLKEADRHWEH